MNALNLIIESARIDLAYFHASKGNHRAQVFLNLAKKYLCFRG